MSKNTDKIEIEIIADRTKNKDTRDSPRPLTNAQIKEIALTNGFKLKEQPDGTKDLNPYVYEFARAIYHQNACYTPSNFI